MKNAFCLFLVILATWSEAAANNQAPSLCFIGESIRNEPGVCNDGENGEQACMNYCTEMLGDDFKGSSCTSPRSNKLRECICTTSCVVGTALGDPHYTTYDGATFDFHGNCTHVVTKLDPRTPSSFPVFQINLKNKAYDKYPNVASVYLVQLIIPQWERKIVIQHDNLTVNGEPTKIPYEYSRIRGHVEDFVTVTKSANMVVIKTSFGLVMQAELLTDHDNLYVYIPRCRELRGKVVGSFGNNDGNPDNDGVDAKGVTWTLRRNLESAAFGTSWCLDGNGKKALDINAEQVFQLSREEKMIDCKNDILKKTAMEDLCHDYLQRNFGDCSIKSQINTVIEDCSMDVCFAKSGEEGIAACTFVNELNRACQKTIQCK